MKRLGCSVLPQCRFIKMVGITGVLMFVSMHMQKPSKAQPARGSITAGRPSTAAAKQSIRLQPRHAQRAQHPQQAQHAELHRHANEPAASEQSLQPTRSYADACPAELTAKALVGSPMQVPPPNARNQDPALEKSFTLARHAGWSSIVRIKGWATCCYSFTHNTALLSIRAAEVEWHAGLWQVTTAQF